MNLIDIVGPIFEFMFPFMVLILAFLVWKAINSILTNELDVSNKYQFKKGDTEFKDPFRTHSKSFYTYMQLAFMTTPNRQKQLVNQLSDRINETKNAKIHVSQNNFSPSLSLLLEDPETWLTNILKSTHTIRIKRKKITSDILYDEIIKILTEVNSLYDIEILPNLEE